MTLLYEHQSTYSANMPLRFLIYSSKLLQKEIGEQSLYASKVIKLPASIFAVFYNGRDERPERWVEKLSDAYEQHMDAPKLELEVLMINVNYGKNKELMEQCRTLKEYALYVAKVRTYAETMEIKDAVVCAVNESIKENILTEFLTRYKAEAIQMSILEYDEEREMKLMRKAEYEVGRSEGKEEGKAEGMVGMIRKKMKKGKGSVEISEDLELESKKVTHIVELIKDNPTLGDTEIARRIMNDTY